MSDEIGRARRSLLREMHQALLSEIGACAAYDHLHRRVHDDALCSVLARFQQEGAVLVERLQELMRGLGGRPRRTSRRRYCMARLLVASSRIVGLRPVLRLCQHAEETVGRWYAEYSVFLLRLGDRERAAVCHELSEAKRMRGRALGAWVANLRHRS